MISGPIPSPGISVAGIVCGIETLSRGEGAHRILELADLDCLRDQGELRIHSDEIISATRRWVEKSVIGLNLCPFAENPYRGNRVRFTVSEQRSAAGLLAGTALGVDRRWPPRTLRIGRPRCSSILGCWRISSSTTISSKSAMPTVAELDLEGELQVASFHPQYQFAESQPDDIENYTNRSPYPMLHLAARGQRGARRRGGRRYRRRFTAAISAPCAPWGMRAGSAYGATSGLRMGMNSMLSPAPTSKRTWGLPT